ncbi:MAG: panthothenate synthetase [Verrucomicrobiae bacterium]|nr:panthothenate synthetase [Verrucomicrobiae bacterium]
MRMLIIASLPTHVFNAAVKDGTAGAKIGKILDAQKPESVYFTELNGRRTAILVVELSDASKIPSLAEPWFLTFDAEVQVHPTMTPDDLKHSGIDSMGKQWG